MTIILVLCACYANAQAYPPERDLICSEWIELSSPWPGYSCFSHRGFPVCVVGVGPVTECKP